MFISSTTMRRKLLFSRGSRGRGWHFPSSIEDDGRDVAGRNIGGAVASSELEIVE